MATLYRTPSGPGQYSEYDLMRLSRSELYLLKRGLHHLAPGRERDKLLITLTLQSQQTPGYVYESDPPPSSLDEHIERHRLNYLERTVESNRLQAIGAMTDAARALERIAALERRFGAHSHGAPS